MNDMITNHADIDVFIGIDIGKHNHHAVALDRDGKQLLSKALPQNETKLRALLDRLRKHGTLLVIVDQPATIGALSVAVAQAESITVAYLPGLAMRRIAHLHPLCTDQRRSISYTAVKHQLTAIRAQAKQRPTTVPPAQAPAPAVSRDTSRAHLTGVDQFRLTTLTNDEEA